jgi:microsomal dipeptidase-like Zn-dependent dipeptidase
MFPPFLARGNKSSVEDYITAIDYVIGIAGEDNIGIGTDFTQDLVPAPLNLSIRAVLTRGVPK